MNFDCGTRKHRHNVDLQAFPAIPNSKSKVAEERASSSGTLTKENIHIRADDTQLLEIFSIEEPTWVFNSGMSKGRNHDRQDFGFILKENTVLNVRQVGINFSDKLTLRLLGNDSDKEKSIEVESDWVSISAADPLVPFVDTPYGKQSATIEYQIEGSQAQKPLPVYSRGGNESNFFGVWDNNDGEYALIKDKYFQLLIPKVDKEKVRTLADFNSLDELIVQIQSIYVMYNSLAGLDDSSQTDKATQNRYFMKADKNGAGGAYYGGEWTAATSESVDMWLAKVSWGKLHEIGHGYQAGFDSKGMYTGEVSNNIFGAQYEYTNYGKEADEIGWLFDYNKKDEVEKNLYDKLVNNNETYETIDLREKLILLVMLKQKAGNQAFTNMYKGYRALANQPGFDFGQQDYQLPELLNHYYSEHALLDFTPVLERWGLVLRTTQPSINRNQYPAVASLADVVPENQLPKARSLLDHELLITTNFEMVTNQEIASLGLTGNLSVSLNVDDISLLKDAFVRLRVGKETIQELPIEQELIEFKAIPNGIYTIALVGDPIKNYTIDRHYGYVKEADNEITINVIRLKISSLVNQSFRFLGLGDDEFATFVTDLNVQKAYFSVTSETPHSYFEGKLYASVKVLDSQENVIYSKEVEGTNAVIGVDEIDWQEGYIITIYHAEIKSRLVSTVENVDRANTTNTWVVTKWGLQNSQISDNAEDDLMKKIDGLGDLILNNDKLIAIPFYDSTEKKNLFLAIDVLDQPYKDEYLSKYSDLQDHPENGLEFQYVFKGLGDNLFATLDVSIQNGQAVIDTKAGEPHSYFEGESYAAVHILDENEVEIYGKDYIGDEDFAATTEKVQLKSGYFIKILHKEFTTRLEILNKDTRGHLYKEENTVYQVTANGLKLSQLSQSRKLKMQ